MSHNRYHDPTIPRASGTQTRNVSHLQSQIRQQRGAVARIGEEVPEDSPGVVSRIFDVLQRGQYMTAEATRRTAENVRKDGFQLGDLGGIVTGAGSGLAGKSKTSFTDVLEEAGVENKWVRGIAGTGLDIVGDPTTYVGFGLIRRVSQEVAQKAAFEAGQKAIGKKSVQNAIERETKAAIKASKSGKLSAKARQQIEEEIKNNAFVKAQTRAEAKHIVEGSGRVEFKFMGKKFAENKAIYNAGSAVAKRAGSSEVGSLLNRAFRPVGIYGERLNQLKRKYEGSAVGKFYDDIRPIRIIGKKLTAEDRRILTHARESGESLKGVMSTGRHAIDLGEVQEMGVKLMDDAAELEIELGILGANQYLPNYVPHIFKGGSKEAQQRFKKLRQKLVGNDDPGFAKTRKMPTIAKAKEQGLDPIEDFVELVQRRMEKHHSTVARFLFEANVAQEFGVRLTDKAIPAEASLDILYTKGDNLIAAERKILTDYEAAKGFAKQADELKMKAYGEGKMKKDLEQQFLDEKEQLEGLLESRRFQLSEAQKVLRGLRQTKKQTGIADPKVVEATERVKTMKENVKLLEKKLDERVIKWTGSRAEKDVAAYKKALEQAKFHETKAKMAFNKLKPTKAEMAVAAKRAKELGYVELKGYKNIPSGVYAPQNVARVLDDVKKIIDNEDEANKLLNYFDKFQNMWKTWATVVNPGHHMRNLMGDTWLNYLAGVPIDAYGRFAGKIKLGGEDVVRYKNGAGKQFTVTGNRLHHLYVNAGLRSGFTRAEFGDQVYRRGIEDLRQIAEAREEFIRHSHFGHALGEELSKMRFKKQDFEMALEKAADKAAQRVRKYNIDYGDFTPFEQKFMKRIIPFYSFLRKNLPLQLEAIAMNPGKVAKLPKMQQMIEVLSGNDKKDADAWDLIPQWMKEDGAAQITGGQTPTFLTMGAVPFMDVERLEGLKKMLMQEGGGGEELFKDFASMASPAIRMPFEMATGRTIFSGAPRREGLQYGADQIPMARMLKKTHDFASGNQPDGAKYGIDMLNYMTGAGVQRVDEGRQLGELRRVQDPLQAILRESRAKKRLELFGG